LRASERRGRNTLPRSLRLLGHSPYGLFWRRHDAQVAASCVDLACRHVFPQVAQACGSMPLALRGRCGRPQGRWPQRCRGPWRWRGDNFRRQARLRARSSRAFPQDGLGVARCGRTDGAKRGRGMRCDAPGPGASRAFHAHIGARHIPGAGRKMRQRVRGDTGRTAAEQLRAGSARAHSPHGQPHGRAHTQLGELGGPVWPVLLPRTYQT